MNHLPDFCHLILHGKHSIANDFDQFPNDARFTIVRKHLFDLLINFIDDHHTIAKILRFCLLQNFNFQEELGEFLLIASKNNIKTACTIVMHFPLTLAWYDSNNETAYTIACKYGKVKLLKFFCLKNRLHFDLNYSQFTDIACFHDTINVYKWLLEYEDFRPPLDSNCHFAVRNNSCKIMNFIFERFIKTALTNNVAKLCGLANSLEMVQVFQKFEINIHHALYFAVWNESIENVSSLLSAGAVYPVKPWNKLIQEITCYDSYDNISQSGFLAKLNKITLDENITNIWINGPMEQLILHCANLPIAIPTGVPKSILEYAANWVLAFLLYQHVPYNLLDIVLQFFEYNFCELLDLSYEASDVELLEDCECYVCNNKAK